MGKNRHRGHTNSQQVHEKMLITNHQGNASQNHNETELLTLRGEKKDKRWQRYAETVTLLHCWWV